MVLTCQLGGKVTPTLTLTPTTTTSPVVAAKMLPAPLLLPTVAATTSSSKPGSPEARAGEEARSSGWTTCYFSPVFYVSQGQCLGTQPPSHFPFKSPSTDIPKFPGYSEPNQPWPAVHTTS